MTPSRKAVPIALLAALAGCSTTWVGHPVTAQPDAYHPNEGYLTHVEIGLRSDGTVVWREK